MGGLLLLVSACSARAFTPQFPLKAGWLGGDTAASIPLDGRHRILWLFSDTFVRQDMGTDRHGAGIVNNTLAVTTWNGYSTNIDYYIRGRDRGAMTSVFPSPGSDTNGTWWYWIIDGFKYNGKVYVFLDRNRHTSDPSGALSGFQGFAVDMAVMDNADSEPNPLNWPLTLKMDVMDSTNIMPGVSPALDLAEGYLYLWGIKDQVVSGWNYRSYLLMRLPLAGLDNPGSNLQYYTTNNLWGNAVGPDLPDARLIMTNGSPDFSIRYHPDLGKYVNVQCDDGFPSSRIWERTSSSMTNGWPNASGATTLVNLTTEPGYMPWPLFYYAGKEHIEFYSPVTGQALVTYCDNSVDTGSTSITNPVNNNSLYVPVARWVQLGQAHSNNPPNLCAITSPADGQNFTGPADVAVSVNAADGDTNDSIVLVNVFVDGALAASTGTAPFNCTLQGLKAGSHTLYAEAYDTAESKTTSASINISVAPYTISQYDEQVREYSPVYYWRFNETNGSGLAYEYYNRLTATYGANATNGLPGVPDPPFYGFETTNRGVAMNRAQPTGGAGYVTAPALNLNTNAVSIVAWLYPFDHITNTAGVVFSRGSTYAVGLGYLGITPVRPDEIGYTWNQNNLDTYNWPSGLFVPPGQWSLVALTIAPTRAVFYLGTNGVLRASTHSLANDVELWDGPTAIGCDTLSSSSRVFNGKIDEVAVFKCTLSLAQVQALYSLALVGGPVTLSGQRSGAGLVLGWPHGTLLQAADPGGPWAPVVGASPPSFTTTPAGSVFYRVQVYP
ncbi:MAG TPA: LamG-like jellyroll fold domain-containing protein [Candidatus Acidoferrum sp.]|nr:LamG-like jellyroll fold domain-containing protein [Candidatus Acidoferrum sp.]